ncbi:WXG100 family type VII secretion target [Streptomyces spirodelae]|uniref:WXG100 family type VII secretion target n=1 Tax=Streptomyces spirodelae TaxID=2812904 RepID=A0ABS3X1Q1_9ACTN|nr:hypothetical protein [Streptomyces spirodelae]MBO8189302.1 hypothetical protein [Streptomyces spirodelae]
MTDDLLRSYAEKVETAGTAFQKVDNVAMRETEQVPGSMKGFASDEAFKQFQKMWRGQMAYVRKRYAAVAKTLNDCAKSFKATDAWTKEQVEKIERDKRAKDNPLLPDNYLLNPTNPAFPLAPGLQRPGLSTYSPLLDPNLTDKPVYGPPVPPSAPTTTPNS